jgi:hypothetical protein
MSVNNGNSIHYRLLPAEEWERLAPLFRQFNWFLPPHMLANAAVAENEHGQIVGLQMLQLVLHAEPAFIDTKYSGIVNYLRLWKILDELPKDRTTPMVLPGYLLVAPNEKIRQMAEAGGFTAMEGTLMKKRW